MQLYLNYHHRAFVFTREMLTAMGQPAYVELWNDKEGILLFVPRRSRSPKGAACWKIPDRVYESGMAYGVGNGSQFSRLLGESIGENTPAVVNVEPFDADSLPEAAFRGARKPSGAVMRVDLKSMETSFYTEELDKVYVPDAPRGYYLVGKERVYLGQ